MKNKKNELTEEQLDNVVGGATLFDTEKDETRSNEVMLVIPLETTELKDEELNLVAGGSADDTSSKDLLPLFSLGQLENNKQE